MGLVKIGPIGFVSPDGLAEVNVGDDTYAVCQVNGEWFALDGICPHAGGPLGQGNRDGYEVVCPWHAWAFDCRTGACDADPAYTVATYPVVVQDGDLYLELPPRA